MSKVYWNQLKVGDFILPYAKAPLTRTQIVKFAAAAKDFGPLHIDEEQAKAEGFGGVFAHGLYSLVVADEALRKFAENMRITSLSGTFHKLVWPGDEVTAKGTITKHYKEHDEARIDIDLWTENQHKDRVMEGKATCILWECERTEKKSRSKLPPLSKKNSDLWVRDLRSTLKDTKYLNEGSPSR